MLKNYYYNLLSKYISIYARSGDRVLFVEPQNKLILNKFSSEDVLVVTGNSEKFRGYKTVGDIEKIIPWEPDYIVLDGNLQREKDIIQFLKRINAVCSPSTRVLLIYYSALWKPVAKFASMLGFRKKTERDNWTTPGDISNFTRLTEFESIKRQPRILIPIEIPYFSDFVNRWLAPLPIFNFCSLLNIEILRSLAAPADALENNSVSVIIPVNNEAGNIEDAFTRIPVMGSDDEWIFVEGNSTDNTWEELTRCRDKYAKSDSRNIKIAKQDGKGKKDAVYKGFSMAKNNILMILDGDLTVPPEDLPKFYSALAGNKGEFINGCRLVYALESDAMLFLNMIANKFFAFAFSYVLSQNLRDTLCGTKVFTRTTYEKIQANRNFFGDFDPFADFDLIFGADRLGLKIVEVPVRYQARTYGATNISRFRHGWLLMKMLLFVSKKLKFI